MTGGTDRSRFQCPHCNSYDVARLFIAPVRAESCECLACGARWDEEVASGRLRASADGASVLLPLRRP